MIFLTDLFNISELKEEIAAGYVREQSHPEWPLKILNYTDKAQIDRHWTDVTTRTRGLIYNEITGEILALPFEKFFNSDEPEAPTIDPETPVWAFDKLDGSLGIMYRFDGKYRVATRGSFTSEQALWANEWLARKAFFPWIGDVDHTCLVEIIYRENRIVVDYGGWEGLVYLGEINNPSGDFHYVPEFWQGRAAPLLYYGNYKGLFELPPRDNAEGFVVLTRDGSGNRVKVKYEEYKRLHRLVTNLTEKNILEAMINDPGGLGNMMLELPEEHLRWASEVVGRFSDEYVEHEEVLSDWINDVRSQWVDRKTAAIYMREHNAPKWVQACFWGWLDNKGYADVIWKKIQNDLKERNKK